MTFGGFLGQTAKKVFSNPIVRDLAPIAGGLLGSAFLPGIGTALGSSLFGGAAGDALATGLGAGLGEATAGKGLGADLLAAGTAGAGEYFTGAAQAADSAIGNGASSLGNAAGFPSSTVAAPTATAAGSAAQVAANPDLIDQAASQVGSTGLTSELGATAPGAAGGALPASTAAAAPTGLLGQAQAALGSPLGKAATALAPVALRTLQGNQLTPQQKALQAQAEQANAQGQQLENYLSTGTLPPGEQAGLDQALQDQIAGIKSDFARRGLSGSTMEQQALQSAQNQAQTQKATLASSLYQTGFSQIDSSSKIYDELMQANIAQDKNLSDSIAAAIGVMGNTKQPNA